jgi:hypothetical protein
MSDHESQPESDDTESTDTPQASSGTSPADADHAGGISDDQLPEDLQPGEDNPLAEPLDPDAEETKSREELEMDATQEDLGNDDGASTAPDQDGDAASGGGAGQSTDENDD